MPKLNLNDLITKSKELNEVSLEAESKFDLNETTLVQINIDLDSILHEWSWRCDKGYPDYNNLSDRIKLQEVLDEIISVRSLNKTDEIISLN